MIIHCGKELGNILDRVQSDLKIAIGERVVRGLDIHSNFDVFVSFYGSQRAEATAGFNKEGPFIEINTLPLILKEGKNWERAEVADAMYYFDIVRDFYDVNDDRKILNTIKKPLVTLRKFEKSLRDERIFERYKDLLMKRGRTYDSYKKIAFNNAKRMREILERAIPNIEKKVSNDGIPSLRHELDHIDFFGSKLHKDFETLSHISSELKKRLEIKGEKSLSKEYASVNDLLLQKMSEVAPLRETRALFFTHSKLVETEKPNLEEQKRKVIGSFMRYVETVFPESILDKIVSKYWAENKMDRETSNYLFWTVNLQRGCPDSHRYTAHPEKVDFDIANQILYMELPLWKARFAANGQRAADAYAQAFSEEPKRLNKTKVAESFEKALEICKGQ